MLDNWIIFWQKCYNGGFFKPKITWGNLNLEGTYSYTPEGMFINAPSPILDIDSISAMFSKSRNQIFLAAKSQKTPFVAKNNLLSK